MADFLFELLSEEIPARMQAKARNDLARMFAECMAETGLRTGAIDTFSTPRRLVLIARNVAHSTDATREEIKGPRTSAPPQALEGFLRKTGLAKSDLEERDGVYFAVIERAGRPATEILSETIGRIVANFPWPKSMRWGAGSLRWVRPLHGILAILGDAIVPVEIDGIASGAATVGHRFHHPGPITIGGAADYLEKLRACHVVVDQEERERLVRDGASAVAAAAGLTLLPDEGLVTEIAGLTEWPVPLVGSFDPEFLDVPREVIVLTMRTNQKYFACTNDEGLLAPAFVCVANVASGDGGKAVAHGNARVLAARLSDARFFWEQDLKIPLEVQAKKLGAIVFHEKLGTLAAKVDRVAKLACWLVDHGVVNADKDEVERAARLMKADLVTGMVGEFPELQGVIGGYIAQAQHENPAVAEAIGNHYKPAGPGDEVPQAPVSVAVALADKLDSLVGFFQFGEKPTGSKDPFALRRAALGILRLIIDNELRVSMRDLIMAAAHPGGADAGRDIAGFLIERLKVQQREAGIRHDMIDAVVALETEGDNVRMVRRVEALQKFIDTHDGADLLTAYKRAANILKKENWTGPQVMSSRSEQGIPQTGEEDPLVLVEEPGLKEAIAEMASGHNAADLPQERALVVALDAAEPKASAAVEAEDFTGAMGALALLRAPIDEFFDHVTVNDPDAAKRERRLNLLMRFRDAVNRVADFDRIEG
ncbi:MAG TPA: glycine--tRNA ligase subunit beta [Sphingomicrobium sp.]|nr:glycine--tRNA ligase subunit beta [Sphingomicrobium sp.]